MSKTLNELEEELGVVLVKRSRKGVLLTDQGREFYRHAGLSVASLRNGFDAMARAKNPTIGMVRIGVLLTVSARIMPDVISRFRAGRPQSHVTMMTESSLTLLFKLRHGEIDMIIGRLPERDQAVGLSIEPLYHERLLFVVRKNHPLMRRKTFSLQKIADYPFIVTGFQEAIRQDIERFIAAHGIPLVEPSLAINNPDFGRRFLSISDAIWCVPLGVVEQDIVAGELVELPIDTSHLRATIAITTRADLPLQDLALIFVEVVRAVAHDLEN